MNIQYIHPADQIVMFMQRVYDKKLTSMSGGNLSVRDNEGNIWITPASIDKGSLTRRDIICVRPNGDCEGPHAPSSELPFHRSVYKLRSDLNAVLHAHPPALVAFSVARRLPELNLTPTVRYMCKNIKMAAYAIPGSQALSAEVGKVFEPVSYTHIDVYKRQALFSATTIFRAAAMFLPWKKPLWSSMSPSGALQMWRPALSSGPCL